MLLKFDPFFGFLNSYWSTFGQFLSYRADLQNLRFYFLTLSLRSFEKCCDIAQV